MAYHQPIGMLKIRPEFKNGVVHMLFNQLKLSTWIPAI